jgi:hypothetical protein
MGFRRQDLQEAFFVPGTHPFRVWGYGTTDTLEEVLRPNYLQGGQAMVQLGELIYVSSRPGRDPVGEGEAGETRAALVMVSGFARGDASVRLVQDFGRPEDGGRGVAAGEPGPAAAPKRGRGRPPGSTSKPRAA